MNSILQEINNLVNTIVALVNPLEIILFGSAVRGETTGESDIDLLIVMPDGTNRRKTAHLIYRSIKGVRIPYDILVATKSDISRYKDAPGMIYREVLIDGRVVYAA